VAPEATELHGSRDTAGPDETAALGAEFAASLEPGDVVLVSGELGSGKTTFVRGACARLGVEGHVTSPSFAIGNRYRTPHGFAVSHVDLYRLGSLDNEDPDLLADYFGPDRIAFVEWPSEGAFDGVRARVRLAHLGGDRRRIEISR
jgi:tRNA threonylcarbamoyladenosine biosynthesis protein TsaE